MSYFRLFGFAASCAIVATLAGCASGTYKARQEQREKIAAQSGLFCEFVNGEQHTDVDVELNFQMAKRCEAGKPLSITSYRNSSEMFGVIYCCQMQNAKSSRRSEARARVAPRPAPASTAPATSTPSSSSGLPADIDDGDGIPLE